MKDRLEELRQAARASAGQEDARSLPDPEDDELGPAAMQAVVFESEPVLDNFLSEADSIRVSLDQLEAEVQKFGQQQRQLVAAMRRLSMMKKESSLTRDIKLQAESLHRRLDALGKEARQQEAELGVASATARIQRSQHAALLRRFQRIMRQHNDALLDKQEKCKQFIVRQLEVLGREVSEEEVDRMVEQGKWDVFNENLLVDANITRAQLSEIEQRHKELMNLEGNMRELRELFLDVFLLVEEQGQQIESIQVNVESTQDFVQVSAEKFKMAARYKKKNPLRRLCCCCCPWRCR